MSTNDDLDTQHTDHTGGTMNTVYRSRDDRMIAGVCGGLGERFGVDPTLIRLGFGISVIFGGAGVLAYIIAWVVMPERGSSSSVASEFVDKQRAKQAAREARTTSTNEQNLNDRLYDDRQGPNVG